MSFSILYLKKQIGKVLFPLGFKNKGNMFFRVVNDVFQFVVLCRTRYNCTLLFSILPLCLGIEDIDDTGYDLSTLRERTKGWWDFTEEDDPLDEIEDLLSSKVLPIFINGDNCRTAYRELVQLEKTIYTEVQGGVILHNFSFVAMCIKAQDYQNAYRHMSAICTINERNISIKASHMEQRGDFSGAQAYLQKKQAKISSCRELLRKISAPDINFLQAFICNNERISLEFIKKIDKKHGNTRGGQCT